MMLSSTDSHRDAARCRELGIGICLTKPIRPKELLEAIHTLLKVPISDTNDEVPVGHQPTLEKQGYLHVLLAEDHPVNQRLAAKTLEKRGHTVAVVEDGRSALDAFERGDFDLILMDVSMPEIDGFEATVAIREKEQAGGGHIPIVAMTAHAMKGDREECLQAGMDDYVAKPIRTNELYESLERLFIDSAQSKPHQDTPSEPENTTVGAGSLDLTVALRAVQGDRELLNDVISAFLEECPELLTELERALAVGEAEAATVQRAAHTIKGGLRTFGATSLHDRAGEIETMGRERDLTDAGPLFQKLKMELDEFMQQLSGVLSHGGDVGDS